ncbi:MAG: hypothetical protein OIF50_02405 [Flavobacteriaceae bacterium]|nr:hypothetical protein [Flavobacteriaceae bacterium]
MSSFYKKWLNPRAYHLIYVHPKSSELEEKDLQQAPDILHFADTDRKSLARSAGYMVVLAVVLYFLKEYLIGVAIIIFVCALFTAFMATIPPKFYTYYRLEGKITLPGPIYRKHETFDFKDAHMFWTSDGHASGAIRIITGIAPPGKKTGVHIATGCLDGVEDLSFLVWYMDKNRPLPPDPIFDPYRDADFERRKAEGFPPPLYKSQIPTPEATPVQQKEREKYWKDRDYYKMSESIWI